MHGERDRGDNEEEGADDDEKVDPEVGQVGAARHGELGPDANIIMFVGLVALHDLFAVGNLVDIARVLAELGHHALAFKSGDGKDGKVGVFPSPVIIEVPHGSVAILGLIGRVVWLVKDEGANGIESRRGKICQGAVYAEPRGESNEVVVGRGEFVSVGDILRDEVVLLRITRRDSADVGHV